MMWKGSDDVGKNENYTNFYLFFQSAKSVLKLKIEHRPRQRRQKLDGDFYTRCLKYNITNTLLIGCTT